MKPQRKSPMEMAMRLLCAGGRITDPASGHEMAMSLDGDLCWISENEHGEEVAHGLDCTLASFKQIADAIGADELWLQCCAMCLRNIK